jgi:hypothetical protein
MATAAEPGTRGRSGRRIAFTVASVLFAMGAMGGLFGVGLVIGWFDSDQGGIHRVHDLGFGILYGIILTVAFVALARRPAAKPSAYLQVLAAALAGVIAGLVSADPRYLLFPLFVIAAALILLALHPARAALLHSAMAPSPLVGTLAVVGSIPLVLFGLTMARYQREGLPADPHVSMDHWANTAAMAFGLVLAGLLASLRIRGWRLTAWCAGVGAAVYGVASIVFHRFPGSNAPYPASEGTGWGLAAVIGGVVFVVVSEWEARRSRQGG